VSTYRPRRRRTDCHCSVGGRGASGGVAAVRKGLVLGVAVGIDDGERGNLLAAHHQRVDVGLLAGPEDAVRTEPHDQSLPGPPAHSCPRIEHEPC